MFANNLSLLVYDIVLIGSQGRYGGAYCVVLDYVDSEDGSGNPPAQLRNHYDSDPCVCMTFLTEK
jgi:hypothetical protein